MTGDGLKGHGLYAAYLEWAQANGEHALSARGFGMQMRERGFQGGRDHGGRFIAGIRLRDKA